MGDSIFEPEVMEEPIGLFRRWLEAAGETELNDPNAMSLATATVEGRPAVRMVLMKRVDERGFAFYTNVESQKGRELLANPRAAVCFHWKSRRRQVRVEGRVEELPPEDADTYFHSRSRRSQIGAVASQQSRVLASREALEERARACAEEYVGEIPRPGYWRGFVVVPERVEFWEEGDYRLHNRVVFARDGGGWRRERLYP